MAGGPTVGVELRDGQETSDGSWKHGAGHPPPPKGEQQSETSLCDTPPTTREDPGVPGRHHRRISGARSSPGFTLCKSTSAGGPAARLPSYPALNKISEAWLANAGTTSLPTPTAVPPGTALARFLRQDGEMEREVCGVPWTDPQIKTTGLF